MLFRSIRETHDMSRLAGSHQAGQHQHEAKLICVLGAAGGGRDKWKRPELGKIATKYCDAIILTNEDPYEESPEKILEDVGKGIEGSVFIKILDRRTAIKKALQSAKTDDVVIITGKGAEPWLMSNHGKIPWDDRRVVREELAHVKTTPLP